MKFDRNGTRPSFTFSGVFSGFFRSDFAAILLPCSLAMLMLLPELLLLPFTMPRTDGLLLLLVPLSAVPIRVVVCGVLSDGSAVGVATACTAVGGKSIT